MAKGVGGSVGAEATRSRDEKPRLLLRTSEPSQGMAALGTEKQSQERSSVSLGGSWRHPHSCLVPMLRGSETGPHHVSVVCLLCILQTEPVILKDALHMKYVLFLFVSFIESVSCSPG